jgi:hypothetical protein
MISIGQIIALVVCVGVLVAIPKIVSHYAPKEYKENESAA